MSRPCINIRMALAAAACLLLAALTAATVATAATPPQPTYGSAAADGTPSEWSLADDYFVPMYEGGDPSKAHLSDAYLRYDCTSKRLNVLVLSTNMATNPIDPSASDAWATLDGDNSHKWYTGASPAEPPREASNFAWINRLDATDTRPAIADGYEASFALDPGSHTIVVHAEVWTRDYSTGSTSANLGFNLNKVDGVTPLVIDCSGNEDPPSVSIVKKVNGEDANDAPGVYVTPGSTVTFTYEVTNDGDTPLTNVIVTDDQLGTVTCPKDALAVAESMTCTATGIASTGQYTNIGTVTAKPPNSTPEITDTDPANYFGADPSVSIVKKVNDEDANTAPGAVVATGSTATFTYLVTNTGNVTLTAVSVGDDMIGNITCPKDTLAPSEEMTCTATATATAGQYTNTGSVTGTPPGGLPDVSDDDPANYYGMVDPTIGKTAGTSFTRTFSWTLSKAVTPSVIRQSGGTATFTYTVTATQTGYTDSDWAVAGKITLTNPNSIAITGVDVTDAASGGASCTVTDGAGRTLPASGSLELDYSCTYASAPTGALNNVPTATWDATANHTPTGSASTSVPLSFPAPTTSVNETIHVTDTFNGGSPVTLLTLTGVTTLPYTTGTLTYTRSVPVPTWNCTTYPNTATITETGQSASQSVRACGPARTGGLTMGFWQNNNGQSIITTGASTAGICNSGTWLRQYAPFQDLSATATCTKVASYVTNVIKAANASGASMNAMLKGQMLATALDVYFSDTALGGNRINAPAAIGGTALWLGSWSPAFGGATSMTVNQMLAYAAGKSNVGGSTWYANVKTTQELAKNAFDAINNQRAFPA